MQLSELENKIIKCKKCPRLVKFRNKIAKEKRKQYKSENYWGKPITGFGNLNAKILIVGLAPAAHGGNRTGRVFTGDKSSDFLYKCLFKANISNQSNSDYKNDGLRLKNAYITTALKCVPPGDKPHPYELKTCFKYFKEEINLLNKSRVIIALGKIAFDACVAFYRSQYNLTNQKYNFSHGINYILPDNKILIGCYHPSPRNVNTKRININKMVKLFNKAKKMI
jgi:uracil-DNA glycosylase family 4